MQTKNLLFQLVTACLIGVATLGGLAGCASSKKADSYATGAVQQKMKVVMATVVDVREVAIEASASGAGAIPGAAVGGIAGSNMGQGKGSLVGTIAGAVVGGVVGTLAEKGLNSKSGVEILYRVDGSNDTLAMVQEMDDQRIQPGDRVRIIEGQFSVRVVKFAAATK